ncbi:unnamed protein product [Calypogeia fissa]
MDSEGKGYPDMDSVQFSDQPAWPTYTEPIKRDAMDRIETAFQALSEEVRELSLGTTGKVERVKGPLSPVDFLRNCVLPGRPCIITDALDHWPALQKWTNDYLCSVLKHQSVSVHFTPDGRADAIVDPLHMLSTYNCPIVTIEKETHTESGDGHESDLTTRLLFVRALVEKLPFPQALELILNESGAGGEMERGVAYAQEQNGCFLSEYGELTGDAEVHIPWATEALGCMPEAVNLWIGNENAVTSFHKDHYENLYAVVAGAKHFTLLPPVDVHRMYIKDYPSAQYVRMKDSRDFGIVLDEQPSMVPWVSVDPYPADGEAVETLFPRYFYGPLPFNCTVQAGEILYLPSMWFHHVRQSPDSEGRTIALNFWYDMQFDVKYAYFNMMQNLL